jgi:hypothetical protein
MTPTVRQEGLTYFHLHFDFPTGLFLITKNSHTQVYKQAYWTQPAQDSALRWALVNTVLNFWFYKTWIISWHDKRLSVSLEGPYSMDFIPSRGRVHPKSQTANNAPKTLSTGHGTSAIVSTVTVNLTPLLAKTLLTVVQAAQRRNSRTLLLTVAVL